MPIFEYVCRECRHRFEEIVFGQAAPACPACKGRAVEKLLSVFAVGKGDAAGSPAPGPCGRCGDPRGPGACATG